MSLKLRTDFITNSSSSQYIVTNRTGSTKNMLDVLRDCAEGEWYLVNWPYYNRGSDYTKGTEDGRLDPKPFASQQEFDEAVARLESFPPGVPVTISIAWGDGEPIYIHDGYLQSSRRFHIKDLGM